MIRVLKGLDAIEDGAVYLRLLYATLVESELICAYYLVGPYFNIGLNSSD